MDSTFWMFAVLLTVLTLVGFLCGAWLRSRRRPLELTNGLFAWGSILVVLAFFWYDLGVPFFQGL